jgi:hypothetical protein
MEKLVSALPDQGMHAVADWLAGISRHHLAELEAARSYVARSLSRDTLKARQAMAVRL